LYKAALFEVDKTRLPDRIAQAEKALALRARELFNAAGDNIEEEQALDEHDVRLARSAEQTTNLPLLRLLRSTRLGLLTIPSTSGALCSRVYNRVAKKALT
jgi:hypothetical protein